MVPTASNEEKVSTTDMTENSSNPSFVPEAHPDEVILGAPKTEGEQDTHNYDLEKVSTNGSAFREADAGDGTVRDEQILHGIKLVMCVVALNFTLFLVALDQMITVPAITAISDHFNSFNKLTWITAGFLMPVGALAQVWGRMAIAFGRKWVLVAGIILFEIGSLVAAVSNSIDMFIVGRVIQGCGGSCIQSLVMIVASEITTIDKKPLTMGMLSLTFVAASVLGPLVGGAFTKYTTWRWCFYINLIFAAFIFPLFIFTYKPPPPKSPWKERIKAIDYLTSFLMVASLCLIMLGISFGTTGTTYRSASVICCMTIGGLLLLAFLFFNHRSSKPVIPVNVLRSIPISIAWLTFSFNYASMIVAMQFLSVYFENIAGHDAMHTGISLMPLGVPVTICAMSSAVFMKKTGIIKPVTVLGNIFAPIGMGLMVLFSFPENIGRSVGFQLLAGIGIGLSFQGPFMNAIIEAPKDPGSSILVTAYMNFGRSIVAALFSEIAGAIYSATLKHELPGIAHSLHETKYSVQDLLNRIELLGDLDTHDSGLVKAVIMKAIRNNLYLSLALSLVGFVFAVLMTNKRIPKKVAS